MPISPEPSALYPSPRPSLLGKLLDGLPLEDGATYGTSAPALYAGPDVSPDALQPSGSLYPDLQPVDAQLKRPGMMGRIMQQPGGKQALLAFGAGLLSSPTFQEGLGKGAMAYQATLDREEERLKPKTQFLSDGAYKATIDPATGQVTMERTPLADFQEGLQDKKLRNAMTIAGIRDDGQTLRNRDTLEHRDRWEQRDDETKRYISDQGNLTDIQVAGIRAANALDVAKVNTDPGGKPPPAAIQKQIGDYTDVRNSLSNSLEMLQPVLGALESGKLDLNWASNKRHRFALATGVGGNDETVLYGQYQTTLESLRNALLIANKGVQTDGDADRAMNELIAGDGDTRAVQNNLNIVFRSLQRRSAQAQSRIDEMSSQYGADTSRSSPRPQRQVRSGTTKGGIAWSLED